MTTYIYPLTLEGDIVSNGRGREMYFVIYIKQQQLSNYSCGKINTEGKDSIP